MINIPEIERLDNNIFIQSILIDINPLNVRILEYYLKILFIFLKLKFRFLLKSLNYYKYNF